MSLELSQSVRDRLERLRDTTEADSLTEVIRRSLAVYDLLINQERSGSTVVVKTREGTEQRVLLVP